MQKNQMQKREQSMKNANCRKVEGVGVLVGGSWYSSKGPRTLSPGAMTLQWPGNRGYLFPLTPNGTALLIRATLYGPCPIGIRLYQPTI